MTDTSPQPKSPERRQRRKPGLERLLSTADDVLYAEGINQTGVQRILELSGVARGTLYGNFAGKDDLVDAYLRRRHEDTLAAVGKALDDIDRADPHAVFDALISVGEARSQGGSFRGCAFALAVAEMPDADGPAVTWARKHKHAIKSVLQQPLMKRAESPERVAEALMVLYDGALLSAALRPGEESFAAARISGHVLIREALLS